MVSQKISNLQLHHRWFAWDLSSLSASLNDSLLPVPVKVVKTIMITERENPSAALEDRTALPGFIATPQTPAGFFIFRLA
jgi:hypothetical protein